MRWVGWLPLVSRWERSGSPCCGFSGCGHRLQGTRPPGVAAPRLESAGSGAAVCGPRCASARGVVPGQGWTHVSRTGRWIPYDWAAREAPGPFHFSWSTDTQHHVSFTCKTRFNIYIHEEVIGTVTLVTTRHHTELLQCIDCILYAVHYTAMKYLFYDGKFVSLSILPIFFPTPCLFIY